MHLTSENADQFVLSKIDATFAQNPYPGFAVLCEHAPVCRQPDGSVFVSRYEDVRTLLNDAARFSSDKKVDFRPKFGDTPLYEHHTTSLVFNDPEYHTRVRRLLAPFFTPRALKHMEERVTMMVDELLDQAAEKRRIDLIEEFALAIPLNLIGDLLGVPRGEREPLRHWAGLILGGLEPVRTPAQLDEGNRAVDEFKAYLRELIAWKRRHPPEDDGIDILWTLIRAHDTGEGLTELEIVHNCIFMLNAGHDTTTSLISNGVDLLLEHPDEMARLRADRALIKPAIEEMMRMESPLQIGNRRSKVEAEICGVKLAAGTFIHLGIAAANRDPRQFPDPQRFDVGRAPNRHLAFGHGIHTCAGNAVARMEGMVAFNRLLDRFSKIERAGPTVRPNRSRFRVVDRLPVELFP